jgi:hypothetical protein
MAAHFVLTGGACMRGARFSQPTDATPMMPFQVNANMIGSIKLSTLLNLPIEWKGYQPA